LLVISIEDKEQYFNDLKQQFTEEVQRLEKVLKGDGEKQRELESDAPMKKEQAPEEGADDEYWESEF
jgi:transposase